MNLRCKFLDVATLICNGLLGDDFTSIEDGIRIAAEYTLSSLQATLKDPEGRWYGVNFEEALPTYLRLLGKI